MKKVLKIIGSVFLVIALIGAGMLFFLTRGLAEGKNLVIQEVNITEVRDGVYIGEHEAGRWTNTVEVSVQDGSIVSINLLDGFNQEDLKESLYQEVMKKQTLMVDVNSGATVSSKAYLKAVENALQAQ